MVKSIKNRGKLWNTKENAEIYDSYVNTFKMCKDTSKDLVAMVDIHSGMTVIDLSAGTGITTQAILNKTGGDVRIIAIDQAEEMLKKAKERFSDRKNIEYIVSAAEDFNKIIKEEVDIIICNASFFWYPLKQKIFKAVSRGLKIGGIFTFNLPNSFRALSYNLSDLELWSKKAGLSLIVQSIKKYSKSFEERIAFHQIPVIGTRFSSENARQLFVANLKKSDPKESQSEWLCLVFKKNGRNN